MGNWMTGAEISRNYAVGEDRLLSYGQRGNLAFRRLAGGAILYDESDVARFFRKRHAGFAMSACGAVSTANVVGLTRLGEAPPRSVRRRSAEHDLRAWTEAPLRKAAG